MSWLDTALEVSIQTAFKGETVKKKEVDGYHPASHYLVVKDPEKTGTWHLRYRNVDGNIDTRLMGAAHAALTVGYRGNKYQGPDKQKALAKLRKLYKNKDREMPSEEGQKGSAKSGNWGHAGRPGKRGGSAPKKKTSGMGGVGKIPKRIVAQKGEKTKTIRGKKHPAGHFLVATDPNKTTTWRLRVRNDKGYLDRRLMGGAYAALTVGYRGKKYSGPNAEQAMATLKGLYEHVGAKLPAGKGAKALAVDGDWLYMRWDLASEDLSIED